MALLKDIAAALNLSIPLVSKVLSGRMGNTGCSQVNREAILAKAKELNYQPNLIARALRTGRNEVLGVLMHPMGVAGSDLRDRLLTGLSSQANVHQQRLWLSFYETDNDFINHFAENTRSKLDRLLVVGGFNPQLEELFKAIENKGIPVVTLIKNANKETGVNVFCDDFQLGYLPTRQLLEQGCLRIAHIHSRDQRYQGYRKALHEFNIEEDPNLVYTAIQRFGPETGCEAVQYWAKNKVELDGLVAESDHQAFGAICQLIKQGRRVPEDVKVFGVDNSPICDLCQIPLSSISQEVETVGRQAVDVLMKRINGETAESLSIQPVLHLRASTGG